MRRWIACSFIACYVSALGYGLAWQTVKIGAPRHPAMYFLIWDMYCAWGAYDHGFRAVAEGVSGNYYELNPPPWGTFRPFNTLDRFQSINAAENQARFAKLVADKTKHEPIARMFVIEQCWPKQYDLPEYIWNTYNAIPRDPFRYNKVLVELSGDGQLTAAHKSWIDSQSEATLADNPRIQQEVRNGRPFHLIERQSDYFQPHQADTIETVRGPVAQ